MKKHRSGGDTVFDLTDLGIERKTNCTVTGVFNHYDKRLVISILVRIDGSGFLKKIWRVKTFHFLRSISKGG